MKQASITLEDYPYGYCEVGERFYDLKSGKRKERVSWIAALKQGNLFAFMTFTGSCNRDLFEVWLEQCLLPQLQPIERWWFVLKNWMRQRWSEFESFHNCIDAAFKTCPNVLP